MSNKYAQSKIYKITGGGMTYIGSTTKKYLCQRMSCHRAAKKRFESGNGKSNYCTSYPILDLPDCQITLIETFPCESRDQLNARERYWTEQIDCINKNIPGRTRQEYDKIYYQQNKVSKAEYNRKYYQQQKNKLSEQPINTPAESPF